MVKTLKILFFSYAFVCAIPAQAAEYFLNLGTLAYRVKYLVGNEAIDNQRYNGNAITASVGIRNLMGSRQQHALGFGVDTYEVDNQRLIGLRAIDYQYQFNSWLRAGAFIGAATLDSGLPQNGYYLGVNFSVLKILYNTDVLFEYRNGNGLARDRLLKDDPEGVKPDIFADFNVAAIALNWRF
ncbi:hypothetical protein P886_2275 [Alteromonadaceae bacterium 2753L.S.0a.02]|nr:hypothetical protein P886_2275 [Alteromonadaceae bacterium 2753L.S.0a.02]